MEWLLLIVAMSGHVNSRIETMAVERFPTETACQDAGAARAKNTKTPWGVNRTAFVCFPVTALQR